MRVFLILGSVFLFLGCGDSKPDLTNRELVQDVKLVPYEIDEIFVKTEIDYESGTTEVLEKSLDVAGSDSKDQIIKTLEERRFVLIINEKRANIAVDAGGRIQYQEELKQSLRGCELRAKAEVDGKAENIDFELRWKLEAVLTGEGCNEAAIEDYLAFQQRELDTLNLFSIRDLVEASNRDLKDSRFIKMEVQVRGQTN